MIATEPQPIVHRKIGEMAGGQSGVRSSGIRRWASAAALAAVAALAACTATSPALPTDANGRLFAQSFGKIAELYIRPVLSRNLAVAGLGGVHELDPKLGVSETPGPGSQIVLLDGGRELAAFPAPRADDSAGWGALIGRAIDRFRAASAGFAGLSDSDVDKAVFNGVTGALDRFSRYAAPAAAREQRAARDGVGGSVTAREQGGVAIFRISGVSHETVRQLAAQLTAGSRRGAGAWRGVVLDLRGNPGGLLDQAVGLTDLFIAKGPIVAAIGRNPASRQYYEASGAAIAPDLPLIVLINGGSASSSEIVAAALQDQGRAVVVGSPSFGKGTVQTVLHLPNDGELTLTWAMLIAPAGYFLDRHGVVPTLCTGDLADDAGVARRLQQVAAGPPAPARAGLDELAWQRLRATCPQRAGASPIDLMAAEKLLADPALYRQTLRALAPAPLPAPAEIRRILPAAGLTGPGVALSSDQPVP